MTNTFIQIHTLTGYTSVLLNRDDTGMAKRIEYGDGVRTRTSSQFAKRKMRTADNSASLLDLGDMGVRSRLLFRRRIAEPLIAEGLDRSLVIKVTLGVMDSMYEPSDKATANRKKLEKALKDGAETDDLLLLERGELLILGQGELDYIKSVIRGLIETLDEEIVSDAKKLKDVVAAFFKQNDTKKTLRSMPNTSLDVAAFGRMVTGDSVSTIDGAVHVAHAFSVHAQQSEVDFFTAVDDLKSRADGEDGGGAHIGEVEINSPLLYAYYVIDFNLLVANLAGVDNPTEVASKVVSRIAKLAATSIVGAKKGSTAPYSTSDFIMIEVGSEAPRSLAEAFRKSVKPSLDAAVNALETYVTRKEAIYGDFDGQRFVMSIVDTSISGAEKLNLKDATAKVEAILTAR
jgi:CRISPR system Cascade subunit CasC